MLTPNEAKDVFAADDRDGRRGVAAAGHLAGVLAAARTRAAAGHLAGVLAAARTRAAAGR